MLLIPCLKQSIYNHFCGFTNQRSPTGQSVPRGNIADAVFDIADAIREGEEKKAQAIREAGQATAKAIADGGGRAAWPA
jgi:hypothetical protein